MAWIGALGAVAGGLLSSDGGGGGGTSTTVQSADPWSGVQPALLQLYQSAMQNFQGGGPQYYPNSTIAPQGGVTQQGQQALYGRAMQGSPVIGDAQQQASDTLNGSYFGMNPTMGTLLDIGNGSMLNANPYVDSMFNSAANAVGNQYKKKIMPGIASMFSGAGRFGSNQMAEGLADAEGQYGNMMSDLAAKIYGGNYTAERALQQSALGEAGTQFGRERALQNSALGMAPGLANADYTDINALLGLGASQDAFSQNQLNADISRWDFNQQAPNAQLEFFSKLLQGGLQSGSTSTTNGSQTIPTNPVMGALGGYLTGSRLSNAGLFGGGGNGGGYEPWQTTGNGMPSNYNNEAMINGLY